MKKNILKISTDKIINYGKKLLKNTDVSINSILFGFLIIFFVSALFAYSSTLKKKRLEAIDTFISSNETVLLKNYHLNQIKSPYIEYDYIVKNNDTMESILKKFSVKKKEISFIVKEIKKRKLSNIVPNQKIKFVLRRAADKEDMEVLKVEYPISKTTYVNIDKGSSGLEITKNVTQLFKKRIVVDGKISNNLYSSAIKAKMEPNVIIEFARIFGFEVDFQRDIRKGDEFEVMYEKYVDDTNKFIQTGKILYAYLNVNNQKIKLYRFESKNDFDFYD